MRCDRCGGNGAERCPACGRVCCPGCHDPACAVASGVQMTPTAPASPTGVQVGEAIRVRDRFCVICGEQAAGYCDSCGQAYCVHHRGGEAEEEATDERRGPIICWNCRLTRNAKAVLFWVTVGGAAVGVLAAFLSRWM